MRKHYLFSYKWQMNCVFFYTTGALEAFISMPHSPTQTYSNKHFFLCLSAFYVTFTLGWILDRTTWGSVSLQRSSSENNSKIVCLFVKTIYLQISAVEARSLAFSHFWLSFAVMPECLLLLLNQTCVITRWSHRQTCCFFVASLHIFSHLQKLFDSNYIFVVFSS